MSHEKIINEPKPWFIALPRILVLIAATISLCSCGVCQVMVATAEPNDDEANMTAAMDVIFPPLLITGYWPGLMKSNTPPPPDYSEIIRNRNNGKMTPERSKSILNAMDQFFPRAVVNEATAQEIEKRIGPPDHTIIRAGRKIDVYQFHSPSGLQERWLVRSV